MNFSINTKVIALPRSKENNKGEKLPHMKMQ
jgi:hypothetical protein